jgi:glutamyl/glutaminyl-tRNA synthetase
MGISHVIRGAEYLPAMSKHAILYKMFDIDAPSFAHVPILVHNQGAKLINDKTLLVQHFKDKGYLAESLVNGLAISGWSPPSHEDPQAIGGSIREFMESEVLNMEDLEAYFNILKVGKSPCKFEEEKVKYLNSQHIKRKFIYYNMNERRESTSRFRDLLFINLPEELHAGIRKYNYLKLAKVMDIIMSRIQFYSDLK